MKKKISECIHCGICNSRCPTLRATSNEHYGPRGRALMVNNKIVDKTFYECTLCGACEEECPINIKIDLRRIRELLVKEGIETEANREMIKNIREYGNPFGELKEDEVPDKLYCC